MTKSQWLLAGALAATLPAFASVEPGAVRIAENAPFNATHGRVTSIEFVRGTSEHHSPAGAVVGGVIGGVLGHQIGNGRGNDAATVAGAIGGAVVGNEVAKEHESTRDFYRISVHFRDGREETYERDAVGDLRVGDRVRLSDNGSIERD